MLSSKVYGGIIYIYIYLDPPSTTQKKKVKLLRLQGKKDILRILGGVYVLVI